MTHRVRIILLSTLLAGPALLQGQTLLNGDFEDCSEPNCWYNLPNTVFNSMMDDVTAFSNTVWTGGTGETDIIRDNCMGGPHGGTYSVMIACEATTSDRLAMHLSSPMIAGTTYRLTLYTKGNTTFSPLHAIEVGYSTSPTAFGTSVSVLQPQDMAWSQQEVFITPTVDAGYITFQVVLDGQNGSVILDDMELSIANSVADGSGDLLPAPFVQTVVTDQVDYVLQRPATIFILDAMGRSIRAERMAGSGPIDLSGLPVGTYLLRTTVDDRIVTTRIIKR